MPCLVARRFLRARLTSSAPLASPHVSSSPRLTSPAEWKDLAAALAPAGVHVYEVDCDAAENKKACRKQGVQAYPTLKLCVAALLFCTVPALHSRGGADAHHNAQLQQGRVG